MSTALVRALIGAGAVVLAGALVVATVATITPPAPASTGGLPAGDPAIAAAPSTRTESGMTTLPGGSGARSDARYEPAAATSPAAPRADANRAGGPVGTPRIEVLGTSADSGVSGASSGLTAVGGIPAGPSIVVTTDSATSQAVTRALTSQATTGITKTTAGRAIRTTGAPPGGGTAITTPTTSSSTRVSASTSARAVGTTSSPRSTPPAETTTSPRSPQSTASSTATTGASTATSSSTRASRQHTTTSTARSTTSISTTAASTNAPSSSTSTVTGPSECSARAWRHSRVYRAGDLVTYGGAAWIAQWWSWSDPPSEQPWTAWKRIASCR